MVMALFTLNAGLDRARRQSTGAGRLAVLQGVGGHPRVRPSEIASALQISPSLVTRQVQGLEQDGFLAVTPDPADRRSCLVSLTRRGGDELRRLQEFGIARFQSFVAGWEASDVVILTRLLQKLEVDKHAVAEREVRHARRPRWAQSAGANESPPSERDSRAHPPARGGAR